MEMAIGLLIGLLVGLTAAAAMQNSCDRDTEKSGVWIITGRAYRLTKIEATPTREPAENLTRRAT